MAFSGINIHSAIVEYIKSQGGNPEIDATWNRAIETLSDTSLAEINFQSNTITPPTEQQLLDAHSAFMAGYAQIRAERDAIQTIENNARSQAQNIPAWASWTETEALNWHDTNIAAKLPVASLTEANVLLTVLETENRALVRMVIAIRNKIFPDLEGN